MAKKREIPPQNPDNLAIIDGIQYVIDKNGNPIFHADGSPLKENGARQCKSRSSSTGYNYRCTRYEVKGYGVCQMHGAGSVLQGRKSSMKPVIGKFSKDLAKSHDLRERYERAMHDPNLLSLGEQIALIQGRVGQLINRLSDEEESALAIDQLVEGAKMLKKGKSMGDDRVMIRGMEMVEKSVDSVDADIQQWSSIISLIDKESVLMKREIDIRKSMNALLPVEEAYAIILLIRTLINEHVTDQKIKNIISEELRRNFELPSTSPNPTVIEGELI